MTQGKALKTILIFWAFCYHEASDEDVLRDTLEGIQEEEQKALMILFGTVFPDDDEIDRFIQVYKDWMLAIHAELKDIISGKTTVDEVIVEQVSKETWL